MVVNDDACFLNKRVVLKFFASKLAPTRESGKGWQLQLRGRLVEVVEHLLRQAHAFVQGLFTQLQAGLARQAHRALGVDRTTAQYKLAEARGFVREGFQPAE